MPTLNMVYKEGEPVKLKHFVWYVISHTKSGTWMVDLKDVRKWINGHKP